MAKPKEERNRKFIQCWKKLGMGNKELGEKFKMSIGGVKGLKHRLRQKDPSLYKTPPEKLKGKGRGIREVEESIKPPSGKKVKEEKGKTVKEYKGKAIKVEKSKVSFSLREDLVRKLRLYSSLTGKTQSSIVEELLESLRIPKEKLREIIK